MPLHDSFKSSANANVRLAKLSSVPEEQDLSFAMQQANKHPKAVIELPWKAVTSTTTFVLKISIALGSEEGPSWTLHAGDTPDSAVLWSHDSMDTGLIQSLISAESDPQRALNSYVDTAKKGDDSIWIKQPDRLPEPVVERAAPKVNLPQPVDLDKAALDVLQKQMRRPETGIMSEASFYWLILQEFNRFQRNQIPYAIVMFEVGLRLGGEMTLPPVRVLHEVASRVQSCCRPLDTLCHYKDPKLVLMLPHTESNDAMQIAMRIGEALIDSPLGPGLDVNSVVSRFGIASMPDTCSHPGILIATSLEALDQAKKTNNSVVLFPSS